MLLYLFFSDIRYIFGIAVKHHCRGIECQLLIKQMIQMMSLDMRQTLASRIISMLRRGELNPYRISEYEKKIGFSLNLTEQDIAIAVAVWENRQMYRK